ncbi:MAG TPA: PKD domain-containing protein [candidate division Zixibacteria bacterium]|nr:PKD domain-containing protein [candidate division Zixibacteria bacterium]
MVEFAIILPVLALLMVMSLDFGRVFFGWVGLQNVARVGANFAAMRPEAFDPNYPSGSQKQLYLDQYYEALAREAAGLNCSPLPQASPTATYIPQPSFDDANGNGRYDLNEHVSVQLWCSFDLLTPLAEGVLGGPVDVTANAVFAVRGGTIAGATVGAILPSASATATATPSATASASASGSASASAAPSPCPLPIANFHATPTKGKSPLTVQFTDTSQTFGCSVSGWLWDFGDGSTSTLQHPTHRYTGNNRLYSVTLTVTSPGGTTSVFQPGYIETCNRC